MALTLGMTGMDAATEAALKTAFNDANARLGNTWRLEPESQADYVVVDMDSMYGPMSWLRLHAADKTVIGLTSSTRTQADFHLPQPVDADSVARLLQQIAPVSAAHASSRTAAGAAASSAPAAVTAPVVPDEPPTVPPTPVPAGLTPAPVPQDQLPEEQPSPVNEEIAPPDGVSIHPAVDEFADDHEPASAAAAQVVPAAPSLRPHAPPAAPTPEANERTLGDWLSSGQARGRLKLERHEVAILIDTEQRQYLGPSALKPLAGHVSDLLSAEDLVAVSVEADWDAMARQAGEPQPLSRLLWLGGLLAGQGNLLPGFDPEGRYQLLKWPQTEREYPKHFRIATAMMKGPSTLAEIAEASGVPVSDVCDFVNANLATGFADIERLPDPEPEPARPTGLFGRLRGR